MATDKKTPGDAAPMNIATISAGFEKGDFLVREEQGNRVYFDFFEEVRCPTSYRCFFARSVGWPASRQSFTNETSDGSVLYP